MIIVWFLLITFALVNHANAGFIVGIIGAIASTTIGSILLNVAIGIALSIGSSLIQGLLRKDTKSKDPGTTLQLRVGGDNPLWFPLGDCATGGVRVYTGTWQNSSETPNEFAVDVRAISALPVSGFYGFWLNDQRVTLDTGNPHPELGYPVIEYRKDGKDFAWIDFYDGTQTVSNPYLLNRFGARPQYPWRSDMIGDGVAYAILTCRYDRNGLWAGGFPSMLAEVGSVNLYDIRKDSSVGGSGTHRWNDPSTWEPSNNAMVRAYNVMRGMHYNGEWVYGGQNWPAFRLPVASWAAGMNACDLDVDGEPQFHGGGTVECDTEPAKAVEELLRGSSGLIAEIGGIYKIRIGAPGAPVYSFTDDNILVTKGQNYDPFPGLESTYNIVRLSYTEPVEKWSNKESPERRDPALIIADDNRELPMSVQLPWVLSNTTAQRIGKTALYNGRRFRKHNHYHPPLAWILEPLDVVAWSSAHNGYIDKSFDIEQIAGNSAMFQNLSLREVDPTDYDWNPATDELEYETVPLVPEFPAAQPMTGWQVLPAILYDNDGNERRPSIEVRYGGELTDIEGVQIQVRLPGDTLPFYDLTVPYERIELNPSIILNGNFAADVEYEVRGKFVPGSDRDTEWSAWLTVTTPNVLLKPNLDFDPFAGVVGIDDLDDDLKNYQDWIGESSREVKQRLEELEGWAADQDLANSYSRHQIRQQVTATFENARAEYTSEINVLAAENLALASRVEELDAEVFDPLTGLPAVANAVDALEVEVNNLDGEITAYANAITSLSAGTDPNNVNTANFRMTALTGPTGYSRIGAEARQGGAGNWRTAGWYLEVPNNDALPTRFAVDADQFIVLASGGSTNNPFVVDGSAVRMNVANIGTVTAGLIRGASNNMRIELDSDRILVAD